MNHWIIIKTLGVNEGDFLVISGKSGCGKTTLLKHLKPSLKPKGEVDGLIILDEEIENDDIKIGFVFQFLISIKIPVSTSSVSLISKSSKSDNEFLASLTDKHNSSVKDDTLT